MLAASVIGCSGNGTHDQVDFNRDVRPILNTECVNCHGGVKRNGDLSLLFRADALAPAESGKQAIVPGAPGKSELFRRISHPDPEERMPRDGAPLSPEEINTLRRWIDQGAEWADHWSYVKPVKPDLPAISNPSWPENEIDHFISAKLDEAGLAPSPEADCPVLLRRVSLDLIGLPPSVEEVESTCQDFSPTAYERFVDSLLASPRYGERWATMWLDLARYADSQGYEKDDYRSIWRYRDWVVKVFNQNMPFDQFTREQLAGDLLPNPTEDQLIATAFHRNTMTNAEGGTDDEEHRYASVIDRVNTTWEVWQGTSFSCAQCHGHPYDPFRQTEYYEFLAFFNNTVDWDQSNEYPTLPLFADDQEAEGNALVEELDAIQEAMQTAVSTPEMVKARQAWEQQLDDPLVVGKLGETWQNKVLRIANMPEEERDNRQHSFIRFVFAEVVSDPHLQSLREQRHTKRRALGELQPTLTPIMRELPPTESRTTHVFERGNFLIPTEEVAPAMPRSMPALPDGIPANRLGVAEWLTSPENPLTARVMVNRFWEQLFGTGIVETLEDFGTQGLPPSHPELLDWLAMEFQQSHQWDIKALLKQLVLSATYQQASSVTPDRLKKDPDNRLLSRGPRFRLSGEQLRDQALAVSGLLSTKMKGPSVMPSQPPGIWQSPYSGAQWTTTQGEDRYRRGLYTYWRRTSPYPAMVTFDSPSREFCVSRRIRTNTPLQALVTLNDPVYIEAAQHLAQHMIENGGNSVEDRLSFGYQHALQRIPTTEVLAVLHGFYDEATAHYQDHPDEALRLVAQANGDFQELASMTTAANVIMNLDEFIMKE